MTTSSLLPWEEVQKRNPLYLNLGGKSDCHPRQHYEHFVSVDCFMENETPAEGTIVLHDLTTKTPLPDNSVDRIHTEDFLHYLEQDDIVTVLNEAHRILKPGARMRISLPDYSGPKNRHFRKGGTDPRYPYHKTLTDKEVFGSIVQKTPFSNVEWLAYWDGDTYVQEPIDYSLGHIHRTPQNDPRCKSASLMDHLKNLKHIVRRGVFLPKAEWQCLRGKPLCTTSLIVDLLKDG